MSLEESKHRLDDPLDYPHQALLEGCVPSEACYMHFLTYSFLQSYELGIITSILLMGKLRLVEIK